MHCFAANAFGTLRTISRIDFKKVFEAVSRSEAELRKDPAAIYSKSDFATRDRAPAGCRAHRASNQTCWSRRSPEPR